MAKNIVVLSDGTGNSASSPFKTNVWRLYQALDIQPPGPGMTQQVVFYDNGVGTETFKPLAALGGAIGLGVWQNVRDIYTFVSRNYQEGDNVYGFGFSRGAFTIRLLMGLIGKCGVLEAASENDLNSCVQMAYEAFRRDFLLRASRQRGMIYHRLGQLLRPPKYLPGSKRSKIDLSGVGCKQHFPDIRFVGVWDTVDAYGLPIDELKTAVDNWVWPMSFADRDPSPQIMTLRHALSLDDARPTFRPVLWNEVLPDPEYPNDRAKDKTLSSDSIQQVWFAGVHANVGGGYPDDGLAFTALDWMMQEAKAAGLRYESWIEDEIAARVNPHGEEYDSRAGIAGYYRYGPRDVSLLSNDVEYKVKVPKVRVSPEAFKRITAKRRDYAPVSLGCDFDAGAEAVKAPDAAALENARDLVWWRRIAYFVTLGLTALLSLFALRFLFRSIDSILDFTEYYLRIVWDWFAALVGSTVAEWLVAAWSWLTGHAGGLLGPASFVLPSFDKYPLTGILALGLLAWVFFRWSPKLEKHIETHAEWAWAEHKFLGMEAQPKTGAYNWIARPLRPVTAFLYRWVWRKGIVNVLGILLGLLALLLLSPYWIWRLFIRPIYYRPPWLTRFKLRRTPA